MIEARTPEKVAAELRSSHIEALSGILAIDGKDGSGKSCLARNLRKIIGGDIVVLDDFLTQKSKGRYVPYLDLPPSEQQ